jgi:hypothetical protein
MINRKSEYINALKREISNATDMNRKIELQQYMIDCLENDIINDEMFIAIVQISDELDLDNNNKDNSDSNKSAYVKHTEESIAKYGINGHRFINNTERNIRRSKNDPEKIAKLKLSLTTFYATGIIPEKEDAKTGYERNLKWMANKIK